MRFGVASALLIAVAWVGLAIAQLWLQPLSGATFIKLSVTAALLIAAILLVTLVVRDYLAEQKMKDDGFLDG